MKKTFNFQLRRNAVTYVFATVDVVAETEEAAVAILVDAIKKEMTDPEWDGVADLEVEDEIKIFLDGNPVTLD